MKRVVTSIILTTLPLTCLGQTLDEQIRARENLPTPPKNLQSGGFAGLQLMPEMPNNVRIRSNNSVEFNLQNGQMRYDGGVQLFTDNNLQLFANRAILDTKKKLIYLNGDVTIYQGTIMHRGDKAIYDYANEKLDTEGLRTSIDPILLDSDNLKSVDQNGRTIYIGTNTRVTTHDVQTPNYWVQADEVKVYPDDRVTFSNMKLYAGETPIFWLPYFSQPLDTELGYHFLPGARSSWGAFLLNRYGVMLGTNSDLLTGKNEDPWLLAQYLVDVRSKRGLGTGVDLFDTRLKDNENLGWLKLYYTNDLAPSTQRSGLNRGFVNEDRYKIEFKHRFEIDSVADTQNLFDINIIWLSDNYYLEDFEPKAYTLNPQPDNTIGFRQRSEYYQAGAFARFHINDFYQTDTRLPEIYFDQVKRPIFNSGILHEGSTTLGYYREDLANLRESELRDEAALPGTPAARVAEIQRLLQRSDYARFHTYQEFSRPFIPTDGFTITPRAGFGYTKYWSEGENNTSLSRKHLYAGIDSSVKFTKRYPDIYNKKLGINQLLHVFKPYANLSVLSTDELDSSFSNIERLTPTVRPRPFDVGRFNAIDDLNNWAILRLGVSNELLTKRDGDTHPWVVMNSYLDYFINDPELNREFSNIYNDIYWNPLPWVTVGLETQFPISGEGFTEISSVVEFMPMENLDLRIRHRYLDSHPTLLDSDRIDLRAYYRINDDWGMGFYQQWELDDATLERQQYSIHRNFDSWVGSVGLLHRDNRERQEYGILFSLTLRELPQINLPLTFDAP